MSDTKSAQQYNVRHQEQTRQDVREQKAQKQQTKTTPGSKKCPNCGAEVEDIAEFCPQCGSSLVPWCTFCGAEIPPGEEECPECGMSRKGVVCPRCGTRNARGFCRKCNEPLTMAAKREMERAMKDPVFLKAARLAVRMAELEVEIEKAEKAGQGLTAEPRELPADILRLKDLLSAVQFTRSGQEAAAAQQKTAPKQETAPAEKQSTQSLEDMRAEYERMKAELSGTLKSMVPPPGSTPQEQRNYYSAREVNVAVKTVKKVPVGWRCNAYGCVHDRPGECVKPFEGGEWIYMEKEVTTIEKRKL